MTKGERLTQLKDLTDEHIELLLLGQDEDEDEVNEGRCEVHIWLLWKAIQDQR